MTAAVLIGLIMEMIYQERGEGGLAFTSDDDQYGVRGIIFFLIQLGFLATSSLGINQTLKYSLMTLLGISALFMALFAFKRETVQNWLYETWDFAKKILPYLFIGVFFAGVLTKLLPPQVVTALLGNNDLLSNLVASVIGTLM